MTKTPSYQPLLIAYRTWPWTLIAVRSFQEYFPDQQLVVIDNNPPADHSEWLPRCAEEQAWLRSQSDLIVIKNPGCDRSPGHGIDQGLQHCREQGHEFLVHLEPDCLISGRRWLDTLLEPCRQGAWMSGSHRRFYGPIHPTPSVWRTDVPWASFAHCHRQEDVFHPRFQELFQRQELLEWTQSHEPESHAWWQEHWDVSQRNWFCAAAVDRAVLVEPTNDFEHFWYGSQRPPDPNEPRFQPYLCGK